MGGVFGKATVSVPAAVLLRWYACTRPSTQSPVLFFLLFQFYYDCVDYFLQIYKDMRFALLLFLVPAVNAACNPGGNFDEVTGEVCGK